MAQLTPHDKAIINSVFNPGLPLTEDYDEKIDNIIIDDEDVTKPNIVSSRNLEIKAIKEVDNGNLNEAIKIINDAIKLTPERPSLYNNRAQVLQLKNAYEEAYNDLTTSINLCSDNYKKTKCQAYCQRGLLNRKFGNDEKAGEDFDVAAKIGSKFAKSQLVELNPYAALCNQMLRKVMEDLK